MSEKCFCHLNGIAVKDATARKNIETLQRQTATNTNAIESIANSQFPENYVKETVANEVSNYVSENSGGFATQDNIKNLSDEIEELKPIVFADGKNNDIHLFEFVNGNINPNGKLDTTLKYRIATKNIICAENDLYFKASSGFAFSFHFYDVDGNRIDGTEWITRNKIIRKGTYFTMNISSTNEDTTGIADINTFKNSVLCCLRRDWNATKNPINMVNDIVYPIDYFNFGFINSGMVSGDYNGYRMSRIMSMNIIEFPYSVTFKVNNEYRFSIHYFNSDNEYTNGTQWITDRITIPPYQKFRILIDDTSSDDTDGTLTDLTDEQITEYIESVTVQKSDIIKQYYYTGEKLDLEKHGFNISLDWKNEVPFDDGVWRSAQGCAIYGDILFHHFNYGNGLMQKMRMYDIKTGEIISEYEMNVAHGCGSTFSNEFYSAEDEFPLLYTDSQIEPQTIFVNRVTRDGATLIKTIKLAQEVAGYWPKMCLDADNGIIWNVGQVNNNTTQKVPTIVSGWDLNNMVENEDGTFTPTLIKQFAGPLSTFNQTCAWFNGRIYFLCSSVPEVNSHPTEIFVIDPNSERVVSTLSNFPSAIKNTEMEGIAFHPNKVNPNKYDMIFTTHGLTVYRVEL